MGNSGEQQLSHSTHTQVDELLVRESDQLGEQMILEFFSALEVIVDGANKLTTTIHWQFQVCLN